MNRTILVLRWLLLGAVLFGMATVLSAQPVYETEREFMTTGDFNGDGQLDIAIIDKSTGLIRIGYRTANGPFDWSKSRLSGLQHASGVSVGKLRRVGFDSLALTSADGNAATLVDAVDPEVPTLPVKVTVPNFGPSAILAIRAGELDPLSLLDLYIGSIYNEPVDNHLTLLRNHAGKFTPVSDLPVAGAVQHANRLALQPDGPEWALMILGGDKATTFRVDRFDSGEPEPVLTIPDLPANVDYVLGNFRGAPLKDLIFYTSGESELLVSSVEAASAGQFKASALKTLNLNRPIKQLVTVDGGNKSRLLAIFGTNEPAELLDFDAVNAPVLVQQLWGATNKCLSAAVALPNAVVLFSWDFSPLVAGRPVGAYRTYALTDGSYVSGAYGPMASLADQDHLVIPEIAARIVATTQEKTTAAMKAYTNFIPGSEVAYEMVPIPGGEFLMGSPDSEKGRKPGEGPQHQVRISPFWMGRYEVTWQEYLLFQYVFDEQNLRKSHPTDAAVDVLSDAVTRPSKPYPDMSFGMGKKPGLPVIAMTQHAANKYCQWLSAKTGHFYRLPTEAEWEYACRAGTTTAYYYGDDPQPLTDYGWFFNNSGSKYQKVGTKKPNPWGLYDMHGNVSEWVLDQYDPGYYKTLKAAGLVTDPWNRATKRYPHSVRGGSWDDEGPVLRSAARGQSDPAWSASEFPLPKGIWHLWDWTKTGFRLVRPLKVPSAEEMTKYWSSGGERE